MSAIQDYLRDYRRSITEREAATFKEIIAAYRLLKRRLESELARIEAEFDSLKGATPAKIRRSALIRDVLRLIDEAIADYRRKVVPAIEREMTAASGLGIDDARRSVAAALETLRGDLADGIPTFTLPIRAIENAAALMGDGSPLIQYYEETLTPQVVKAIREEIITGIATGRPFASVARAVRKAGDITRWRSLAVARTETLRIRRESALQVYREAGNIPYWEWVAVKSERTCVLCLAMDGTRFPIDKPFPQHVNCRCTMIAVMPDLAPIKRVLGRDWFRRQSPDVQEKILGNEGYLAYIRGEVRDLKDYVAFRNNATFGTSIARRPLAQVISETHDQG